MSSPDWIKRSLEYSWLNITPEEIDGITYNPLKRYDLESDPIKDVLRLMRKPENFAWTCRYLFNIELPPIQLVILQELWRRPFPMLIASRGAGKSFLLSLYAMLRATLCQGVRVVIVGSGFRQAKYLFDYCCGIWRSAPALRDLVGATYDKEQGPKVHTDRCTFLLGSSRITALPVGDGCVSANTMITSKNGFTNIAELHNLNNTNEHIIKSSRNVWSYREWVQSNESYCNGERDTLVLTTKKGFQLEGTLNHKIKVVRNNNIVWSRLDELLSTDKIPIDCNPRWHDNDDSCTEKEAYCLGLMIGDGCWTSKRRLRFATKDIELLDGLNIFNKSWCYCGDNVHYNLDSTKIVKEWKEYWGFSETYTKDKYLPERLLRASKPKMMACIRGIFDTDGCITVSTAKGGFSISITLTNTSKKLIDQIHYILTHCGIAATKYFRDRNIKWNRSYELHITGADCRKFYEQIGFGLSRKQKTLEYGLKNKVRFYSRNRFGNLFYDEIKSIECGKCVTYDMHVPKIHEYTANGLLSHNSRIRGERANITIGDEFGSQNKEIFETVIGGFGVVQSNPIENMKRFARLEKMRELGVDKNILDGLQSNSKSNQTIISGTADFSFGHFCAYWKRWKTIIESRGNNKKLLEFGIDDDIDWRDYSIIRIPVDLIPGGYFDAKQLARSKATQTIGIYQNEFGAVFSDDSIGFFPMSLINSCVVNESIDRSKFPKDIEVFTPILIGNPDLQYIYGIDPASQRDNFSIFILECRNNHCRIVYGWSTKMSIYKEKVSKGLVKHSTFYGYTARKVRDLMKVFPCNGIAIDSQGGGHAVMEAFNDPQNMEEGEIPIWEIIDPDKEKPTDDFHGLHIVELVQFSSGEYTGQANHNLKKDMEDKVLLFPEINAITLALSEHEDNMDGRLYDTLEDCIYEIEELKRELITITHTKVGVTNRDRWDTPELKLAGGKKGRMHKDRYSALLMANALARRLMRNPIQVSSPMTGGFAKSTMKPKSGKMYVAPDWFTRPGGNPMKTECLGFAVKKGV